MQTQNDLGFSTEQMNGTIYGAVAMLNAAHDAGQITDDLFARLSAQISGIPIPDPIATTTNAPDTEALVKTLGDTIEKIPDRPSVMFGDNATAAQDRVDALGYAATTANGDYWLNFHIGIGAALNQIDTLRNAAASVKSIIELGGAQGAALGRPLAERLE